MRKIAIALSKGGVGKTTTAVNLAAALVSVGRKILLVDADVQGQCAIMLGLQPEAGLAELLLEEVDAKAALSLARPGILLLAGGPELSRAKRDIARQDIRAEETLKKALAPFEGAFDYVLVDTAPSYDVLTLNVLFYVDEVLAPVSMEVLALDGMGAFQSRIEQVQQYKDLELRYVLPTFLDGRVRKSREILDALSLHFKDRICNPVHYSVKLSEAPGRGQTIYEYAGRDRAARDYAKLAGRVERG